MDTLSVREAAKLVGATPKAIRRFIRQGRLPAIKGPGPNGNMYRVAIEDLERLHMELSSGLIQDHGTREAAPTIEEDELPILPDDPVQIPFHEIGGDYDYAPDLASKEAHLVTLPIETWEKQQEIYQQSMVTIGQLQGQLELLNLELDSRDEELRERLRELQKMQNHMGKNELGNAVMPILEKHRERLDMIWDSVVDHDEKQTDLAQKTLNQLTKGEAQNLELSKEILTKMERRDKELSQIIRSWRDERERRMEVKTNWWSRFWNSSPSEKNRRNKPTRRAKAMT